MMRTTLSLPLILRYILPIDVQSLYMLVQSVALFSPVMQLVLLVTNYTVLHLAQGDGSEFQPVEVGRSALTRLHRSEVMVKEWGAPIGNQYYRSVMPDFPISLCGSCDKVSRSSFPTHLRGLDIHNIVQGPL